ncbi:MAG: DUF934 domain-containing protein [Pseudomonadota bacterium]
MQLIVEGRFVSNDWRDGELADVDGKWPTVVTLENIVPAQLSEIWYPRNALGLLVSNETRVADLFNFFSSVGLFVVAFPSLVDGRGFSTAVNLRRLGFNGEIRARGELIPDQYHHVKACGIDSIEITPDLSERHSELEWRKAWQRFPSRYQLKTTGSSSIVARRHRGLTAAETAQTQRAS